MVRPNEPFAVGSNLLVLDGVPLHIFPRAVVRHNCTEFHDLVCLLQLYAPCRLRQVASACRTCSFIVSELLEHR